MAQKASELYFSTTKIIKKITPRMKQSKKNKGSKQVWGKSFSQFYTAKFFGAIFGCFFKSKGVEKAFFNIF